MKSLAVLSFILLLGCGSDDSDTHSSTTDSSKTESQVGYTYVACEDSANCFLGCLRSDSQPCIDACYAESEPMAALIFELLYGCVVTQCNGDFSNAACVADHCQYAQEACFSYEGAEERGQRRYTYGTCVDGLSCNQGCYFLPQSQIWGCIQDCKRDTEPTALALFRALLDCQLDYCGATYEERCVTKYCEDQQTVCNAY